MDNFMGQEPPSDPELQRFYLEAEFAEIERESQTTAAVSVDIDLARSYEEHAARRCFE